MNLLASRFNAWVSTPMMIKVISQGWTEKGQFLHTRYDSLPEDE
jgi:hypothetical protein